MKTIIKKIIIVVISLLCIIFMLSTLSACSLEKVDVNAMQYEGAYSFDKTTNNDLLHLGGGTIRYYIDPSVQGDYRKIAEHAIEKANSLTSKISIKITDSPDSNFYFSVVSLDHKNPEVNAMNYRSYIPETGEIVKSNIQFVSKNLDNKSLEYKKHTALHEMLHTFGLGHIEAKEMIGKTLMTATHPEEQKYQMDDYSEFDRANIIWKYGI